MIWARRRLGWMDYVPFHERITELHRSAPAPREFMMVARKVGDGDQLDVYVALPNTGFLRSFDGFELIPEDLVPTEIDMLLLTDRSKGELERFSFRNQRMRTEKTSSV